MPQDKVQGVIKSAEYADVLSDVAVCRYSGAGRLLDQLSSDCNAQWEIDSITNGEYVTFSKNGYQSKTYHRNPPAVVRLLEEKLIGYQERLWFQAGEKIKVYVHSPVNYDATLFRHGKEKQKILEFKNNPQQEQTVPDGFFVEEGLNWGVSFEYDVPEGSKPGLYSLLLEGKGQDKFAIPFVVSTSNLSSTQNRLLVVASTNTWQSYNLWGGRSRYTNYETLPGNRKGKNFSQIIKSIVRFVKLFMPIKIKKMLIKYWLKSTEIAEPWMYRKLSIRRPFTNCALESDNWKEPFTNHLAGGEWRLLAWLEENELDYNIISGAELHFNPGILAGYKAVLFSTHCEYWSCEMFQAVKSAHEEHGLWIINLSGNTMYRQIEFYEDGSTRCVSLLFARTCADETKLIGVRFTNDDYGTCAPYKALVPEHWVFKNTTLNNDDPIFGKKSLNRDTPTKAGDRNPGRPSANEPLKGEGASGWETDKLSSTAPKDFLVIAKGMNSDGGADMVVREPKGSRGGGFSASSIVFAGALSIDPVCSSIVKNVLKRAMD